MNDLKVFFDCVMAFMNYQFELYGFRISLLGIFITAMLLGLFVKLIKLIFNID